MSVAAVVFYNVVNGKPVILPELADDAQAQEDENGNLVWVQAYDLERLTSELGDTFYCAIGDYAGNETDAYRVSIPGDETLT